MTDTSSDTSFGSQPSPPKVDSLPSSPKRGFAARTADNPARSLLLGYIAYMLVGTVLLLLPIAQETPQSPLDVLFIATSAVSTTGLVTIDPGTSFTLFGEAVILGLIQLGGLGYMTIGSFAMLVLQHRLSQSRETAARTAFELPKEINAPYFLISVVVFTLLVEGIGVALLYPMFEEAGVENAFWVATFHAVSAFCTAGFSLFSTSLEAFVDHPGVVLTISALSLLGAIGFLVVVDAYRALRKRSLHLGFTTKVIFYVTGGFLAFGTVFLALFEPQITSLPWDARLLAAFFQAMTAATTVGFNTVPIGAMAPAMVMVLLLLMMFGASPAGTGGGLKTTSFAVLFALVRSTLKGRERIQFAGRTIPRDKVRNATVGLVYYAALLSGAMILLLSTETGRFEVILFEAMSSMGTVGLSMGITGDLTAVGKLTIIVLMTAGRLGILTFGLAIAVGGKATGEDEPKRRAF
ncbi:TrkH family potassium uptake protein [Pseudaestuariivita sp.]|uniref:TrkH family potassium uptake protein n=1 Tax=Pseudaestuariivita sp. TaxID=2211669 RepID=UPI00405A2741